MNFRNIFLAASAATMVLCAHTPTSAEGFITELRLGIMDHDSSMIMDRNRYEPNDADVNVEVRFATPEFLSWAFSPNPLIGANISTGDGTNVGYAGLGWKLPLTEAFFLDLSFSGAIHDGETDRRTAKSGNYGCRFNFHESVSLGYNLDNHNAIMLTVDHMSNGGLCEKNDGITNTGIRYAYTF